MTMYDIPWDELESYVEKYGDKIFQVIPYPGGRSLILLINEEVVSKSKK